MTVKELVEQYLRIKTAEGMAPSTLESQSRTLRDFVLSKGDTPVEAIRVFDVYDWSLRPSWSPSSQAKAKKTIRSLFGWAEKMGLIPSNPISKIEPGKISKRRAMTQDEYEAILAKVKKPFKFMLMFMRACGCRPGEAAAVKWTDVDMGAKLIRLNHHKTVKKTGKPRLIPINDEVRYVLAAMHQHKGARSPDNYIFPTRFGGQWQKWPMCRSFIGARERAGVDESVTMHSIRHLYATDAVERGMNISVLSRILGHESIETTLRTYVQPKDNVTAWLAQMDAVAASRMPSVQTPEYSAGRSAQEPGRSPSTQPEPPANSAAPNQSTNCSEHEAALAESLLPLDAARKRQRTL